MSGRMVLSPGVTGSQVTRAMIFAFVLAVLTGCGKKAPLDPPPVAGVDGGVEAGTRAAPPV